MKSYNIGSIVMIVVLAAFTCVIAGRLLWLGLRKKSKVEFRNYIKTYKFGKFLWVYLLAIPLFAMSYHYSGCSGFDCFFKSFTSASKLLALQFDVSLELAQVNELYKATVIFCYLIAILNLVLFVTSCLAQIVWNGLARIKFLHSNSDKCLILGNNPNNELFYNSIKNKHGHKVKRIIADVLDKSGKWDLYTKNIHYHGSGSIDDLQKYIEKLLSKFDKKFTKASKNQFPKFKIIINFEDDKKNANMCIFLSNLIGNYCIKKQGKDAKEINNYLPFLDIYIYSDNKSKPLYENLLIEFGGCLHLVNAQEIIAIDFIEKYPLAKYLTKKQINYDTSLLNKDTKISVSFVGFGQTQQQIFKLLYSNTQFAKKINNKIVIEKVQYNIYDKTETWETPDFRDTFNRYNNEFLKKYKAKDYLPLAEMTEPKFIKTDITSKEFIDSSIEELKKHNDGNNLKYVVISLGDDFTTIKYVNKLWKLIVDGRVRNCHLFVKINEKDSFNNIKHIFEQRKNTELNSSCNAFGCLIETAYNYDSVVIDKITNLAILADALYNAVGGNALDLKSNIVENARNKWTNSDEFNRYSSICAILNLRSKLLCMGLDYVSENDSKKELFASHIDYWKKLDSKYLPASTIKANDDTKLMIKYSNKHYFKSDSRRWTFMVVEHNRWNAFERSKGFIPKAKSTIKGINDYRDKEKDFTNACITTMSGLNQLQNILVKNNSNKFIEKLDKIQFDSLNLDAAWHILKKNGYKIVAKEAK